MIKEALQYITGLASQKTLEINGQQYSNHSLNLIKHPTPAPLSIRSLSGFVDYLKSQYDAPGKLMIHVESPTKVSAFSSFNDDRARSTFAVADALLPNIHFDKFMDVETFNIMLQSLFVPTDTRAALLKVVGNIKEENVQNTGDDGVTQQITAKTGVATVANVTIPNPVTLLPYRTFVEVQQPQSLFVFRMRSGPAASLIEADGGAWKVEAMDTVKAYLEDALKDEIAAGEFVIIA